MATFDSQPERPSTTGGRSTNPPPTRPNEHPWGKAFGAAVPVYIVVLIVLLPASTGGSGSYAAGQLIWPAVLGALAAGAMAKESPKVWHWWTYFGVVGGVAAFVVGLIVLAQSL
jgi:hypothetical protein